MKNDRSPEIVYRVIAGSGVISKSVWLNDVMSSFELLFIFYKLVLGFHDLKKKHILMHQRFNILSYILHYFDICFIRNGTMYDRIIFGKERFVYVYLLCKKCLFLTRA